jgi:hypothetical protein
MANQSPVVEPLPVPPPTPLTIDLRREPGLEWFVLTISDGSSEELDPEDTRTWFKQRGANMDAVEKALDYCWNFYKATIVIKNPKTPPRSILEPTV